MSRFWRVDKALEDSEGLRWIRERLGAYDWSTKPTGSACGAGGARSTPFEAYAKCRGTEAGTELTAT
jgi:hypothetical protein